MTEKDEKSDYDSDTGQAPKLPMKQPLPDIDIAENDLRLPTIQPRPSSAVGVEREPPHPNDASYSSCCLDALTGAKVVAGIEVTILLLSYFGQTRSWHGHVARLPTCLVVIQLIAAACVLIGVWKRRSSFMLPYMIANGIRIGLHIGLIVLALISSVTWLSIAGEMTTREIHSGSPPSVKEMEPSFMEPPKAWVPSEVIYLNETQNETLTRKEEEKIAERARAKSTMAMFHPIAKREVRMDSSEEYDNKTEVMSRTHHRRMVEQRCSNGNVHTMHCDPCHHRCRGYKRVKRCSKSECPVFISAAMDFDGGADQSVEASCQKKQSEAKCAFQQVDHMIGCPNRVIFERHQCDPCHEHCPGWHFKEDLQYEETLFFAHVGLAMAMISYLCLISVFLWFYSMVLKCYKFLRAMEMHRESGFGVTDQARQVYTTQEGQGASTSGFSLSSWFPRIPPGYYLKERAEVATDGVAPPPYKERPITG